MREKTAKIMIVDDEHDLREMVGILISKEGFKTETAEDGSDFLSKLDTFDPDLVTLDVMMPGLTTSEILEKLKGKKSKPKIILLTVLRYSEEEKRKTDKIIMEIIEILRHDTKDFLLSKQWKDFLKTREKKTKK